MKKRLAPTIVVFGSVFLLAAAAYNSGPTPVRGALGELVNGNRRYASGKPEHERQTKERRSELANAQHPFAVVVGCSDSRVPPEVVFDQGLGDLFVVRVAGNVVDQAALGSIEYAVEHLGASLIVVLGHERCGAIKAALDGVGLDGHIGALAAELSPAIKTARSMKGDDLLDNAVRANVLRVVDELETSEPILAELVHDGKLEVVGARYDLDTGEVDYFPRRRSEEHGANVDDPTSDPKAH